MARPRSFDETEVLTRVMHLFRRQGYAATSVRDLEAASGLTSGSLYNSYGDKQGLFRKASAHYNRTVLRRRLDQHAPPGTGTAGLRALFLSSLDEPGGGTDGCLVTNSAIEFGPGARPDFVVEGFEALSATFADRAGPGIDATALLALYQGVLVLVRSGFDRAALAQTINRFFDNLEADHVD